MLTKWTTLYKYVPLEYVVSNLDKHRLYLNDGKSFNDPFEITVTNNTTGIIRKIDGLHILSLTNSFQNKLIWSHYSKSHTGVCLTVKVPEHLVYPMCYSRRRVYENSDLDYIIENSKIRCKKNIKKSFSILSRDKKIAYIKDSKWSYENEYRIVFDQNDENGLIFENGKWYMSVKITNVYLGANFAKNSLEMQNIIKDACERNNIKIAQMVLSNSDYSLKVRRNI